MTESVNPYAPTASQVPLEPTVPEKHKPGRLRYLMGIILSIVLVVGTIPAAIVAQIEIESIVFSGGCMLIAAVILLGVAFKPSMRSLLMISAWGIAIVVSCFLTIFLNSWSPSEAAKPIGVVASAFMQLGWLPILWTMSKRKRRSVHADGLPAENF